MSTSASLRRHSSSPPSLKGVPSVERQQKILEGQLLILVNKFREHLACANRLYDKPDKTLGPLLGAFDLSNILAFCEENPALSREKIADAQLLFLTQLAEQLREGQEYVGRGARHRLGQILDALAPKEKEVIIP